MKNSYPKTFMDHEGRTIFDFINKIYRPTKNISLEGLNKQAPTGHGSDSSS